jgi:hypothetical protein
MDKADVLQFILRSKQKKTTTLDLSNKGITELPDEIGDITWIKALNLSYNNITSLPSSICELVNLEKLFLTRNKLTKLPVGLANLQKLKILDLSYNPLVKIPREIGLYCNLDSLDASFCELRSLPIDLTNLYNLKTLNLEENPLEFPPQKVIKRGLYAIMHFLSMEKRKKEASRVMIQIFNLPEKIQPAFKQYIRYFNQMVSEANQKDVVFDLNFVNQDFYQEMDLNAGVEGYLYDIMRYIQEKVDTLKQKGDMDSNASAIFNESRINELKSRLHKFNDSLDDKIDEIRKIKTELKGLSDSLDD